MNSSSSSAPPASSSSNGDPIESGYVEFLDPTEKFQSPPPTRIALGELLAEADFIAVVYSVEPVKTDFCIGEILKIEKMCAVRDTWDVVKSSEPHILSHKWGFKFLLEVKRPYHDVFRDLESFDIDAYHSAVMFGRIPYLYFGKIRPVTPEQAAALQENCPEKLLEPRLGEELYEGYDVPAGFEISPRTPVRAVQGQRGVYSLASLRRVVENIFEVGDWDQSKEEFEEALRSIGGFKYLIQTYGEPDVSPLVRGLNRLLEALSKEPQEARQALGALREDLDPVVSAAADYLMKLEKLPRFEFEKPVPLPIGD